MSSNRKKRAGKENAHPDIQSPSHIFVLESSVVNQSTVINPFPNTHLTPSFSTPVATNVFLGPQSRIPSLNVSDSFSNSSNVQGSCITESRSKKIKTLNYPLLRFPENSARFPLQDITTGENSRPRPLPTSKGVNIYPSEGSFKQNESFNIVPPVRNLEVEFDLVQNLGNNINKTTTGTLKVPYSCPSEEAAQINSYANTSLPNETIVQDSNLFPGYDDIGDPIWKCSHCGAKFWKDERMEKSKQITGPPIFNLCCAHGKIQLSPIRDPPQSYKDLLYGKTKMSKKFQTSMRMYNMMFAFTSLGGKLDKSFNTGRSAPNFRLNGENFHLMGSLIPPVSSKASFAQLYIYDTENEIMNRVKSVRKEGEENNVISELSLHTDIISFLKKQLDEHNILVQWFRYAGGLLKENYSADIKLRLISRRNTDGRRYNMPQASEVAALIVGDIEELENRRDIIVETQSGRLNRIDELHTSYLPLQYPLLFFYGEDGYRDDIPHCKTVRSKERKNKFVTMREYFSYRLLDRDTESPHIFFGRRLFQQFIVDAYTMVESYRITYLRTHQQDLRSGSYAALDDALNHGENNPANTGKRIILPSSFVGGTRYMIQKYHDAMAICRWIGYPNLFITFTCNPKWPEVQRYLKCRGLTATDRPDILSRIFHSKLDNLLRDIRRQRIFGETSAVIYTIEFQKRGLPHAHILLFLKEFPQTASSDLVDRVISAEIPDENVDREYFDAVKEFMMHGPCGKANPKSPCMDGSRCSKHFPKKFVNRTTVDNDGYVVYKRRDNGRQVLKGGIELDNRHVVPHNPFLLKKYRAHINVEWCNRLRSIKYLFKYVHKGNDRATAVFYQSHNCSDEKQVTDEIKQYLDCRYISASEAAWRLFGYEIHFNEPNIVRLQFHLPNQQSIVYKDGSSIGDVLAKQSGKETMFTAWMIANKKFEKARTITYAEFPKFFVWNDQSKSWRERQKGVAIGRLSYVYPGSGELYYMRILLNYVRGCLSYDDIYVYNGIRYGTYKETCYARGLLDDDKEYVDAITEASFWGSESMLRSLFVNLLTSDSIIRPEYVWLKCQGLLAADLLFRYRRSLRRPGLTLTNDQVMNLCLREIETLLHRKGKSLRDYPTLPYPENVEIETLRNRLISNELAYDKETLLEEANRLVGQLNEEQRVAYQTIIQSCNNNQGRVFFLYGYGGTGKTFVWRTLSAAVRSRGHIVLNVASSGIASLLLPGGRTAHSRFSIPLNLNDESTCNITQKSDLAELIKKTKLIIWDEAPMMHRNCFEALDRTIRDIMRVDCPQAECLPFGGKVIVFGGDFRQILPVIPKGTRQDIVHATINSSVIWRDCKVLRLTKNMRLQNIGNGNEADSLREFSNWMSSVGDGTYGGENDGEINIEIPADLLITHSDNFIASMVEEVYPSLYSHIGDINFLQGRAILAPTLEDVDSINEFMVSMHNTDEREYLSSDSIETTERGVNMFDQLHSVEFLNTIKCSGMPNHQLKLKVGVPVMLLRNIDHTAGLCNGTRLVITKLGTYVIEARVLDGKNATDIVYIPRLTLTPSDARMPFRFQRRQFPLMISYAMTINKSQGQSLSKVGIFLKRPVFTHGQLYVAISRVTNRQGLKLLCCDENEKITNKTTNVVYKEVFQNL